MKNITNFKIIISILMLIFNVSFGSKVIHWPNKRSSILPGDLYLAGFFPIHEIDNEFVCGKIEVSRFLYILWA